MNPETASRPLGKRGVRIGRRRVVRIERPATIQKFGAHRVSREFELNPHGFLLPLTAAVGDGIHEQLFERQVQVAGGLPIEAMLPAEMGDRFRQAAEFAQTPIQYQFRDAQIW